MSARDPIEAAKSAFWESLHMQGKAAAPDDAAIDEAMPKAIAAFLRARAEAFRPRSIHHASYVFNWLMGEAAELERDEQR